MPRSPAQAHPHTDGHYSTPLRSPVPMRSPQTPGPSGLPWSSANEQTPRAIPMHVQGHGTVKLAPPMAADVLRWAADVPLPLTPATPAGFTQGTPGHAYIQPKQQQQLRTTRTAPASPRTRAAGPGPGADRTPGIGSAAVDQDFLDSMVQRLTGLENAELAQPPFSQISNSTMRNLDRLGGTSPYQPLRRRGSPPPPAAGGREKSSGSPNPSGRPTGGKMQNVFRMIKDKENQNQGQGGEPALRRKRSVFGTGSANKENRLSSHGPPLPSIGGEEYGKDRDRDRDRKSVYAPGAFATPLDTKFGQNVPGGMKDANRKGTRRESLPILTVVQYGTDDKPHR